MYPHNLGRRVFDNRAAAAPFSDYDCRDGDLGQRPPLPLRRRLIAVGHGDDAAHGRNQMTYTKSCYLRLNECFPTRRRFDLRLANGEVRHAEADPITSGP